MYMAKYTYECLWLDKQRSSTRLFVVLAKKFG